MAVRRSLIARCPKHYLPTCTDDDAAAEFLKTTSLLVYLNVFDPFRKNIGAVLMHEKRVGDV